MGKGVARAGGGGGGKGVMKFEERLFVTDLDACLITFNA